MIRLLLETGFIVGFAFMVGNNPWVLVAGGFMCLAFLFLRSWYRNLEPIDDPVRRAASDPARAFGAIPSGAVFPNDTARPPATRTG